MAYFFRGHARSFSGRHRGAEEVRGEVLAYLDQFDDTLLMPTGLRHCKKHFRIQMLRSVGGKSA